MKSKLKKLMAAAAVSLAFSAPASAAIGVGEGASLFLEAFDTVTQASYVRDLGVTMNNFGVAGRTAAAGFTNIMNDQATDAFSSVTDATWSSFIAGVANSSTIIWDVIAVDNNGATGVDLKRVVFTAAADVMGILAGAGAQWTNNGLATAAGVENLHVPGANVLLGAGTSALTTNPADPGNYQNGKFNTLAGGLGVALGTTSALLGQSMGFYYATRSGAVGGNEVTAAQYSLGTGEAFQWTLDSAGNLTYGVSVAAVPEPTTWALFAAGALMLGGMARRRLS